MESPIFVLSRFIPIPFLSRFYPFFRPYPYPPFYIFSIPIPFLHNHKYKHSSEVSDADNSARFLFLARKCLGRFCAGAKESKYLGMVLKHLA
jgi:hypothetical protein